jgi:hypothetical protein
VASELVPTAHILLVNNVELMVLAHHWLVEVVHMLVGVLLSKGVLHLHVSGVDVPVLS